MSRTESLIIKGIAILFMLFYHLFHKGTEAYTDYLYIADMPVTYYIARVMNPVAFFLVVTGYGAYVNRNTSNLKHIIVKLCRLYVLFWLISLTFVFIARFVLGNSLYPGSALIVFQNMSGILTSWNYEAWFLLPYALVAISSNFIIRFIDNRNPIIIYALFFSVSVLCGWLTPRLQQTVFATLPIAKIPLLFFNLLPAFLIGVYMAKYQLINKIRIGGGKCLFLILIIVCARIILFFLPGHDLFVGAVIVLLLNLPRPQWVDKILIDLGRHSTSMWLIHSWFCYYLFKDFIYSFYSPMLIFAVLLLLSWVSAIVADYLNKLIQRLIFRS